jgi:hypothetical protein
MIAALVERISQIPKRLRSVATAVQQQHRRRARPVQLETLAANDDAIGPDRSMAHRQRCHTAELHGAEHTSAREDRGSNKSEQHQLP